VSRELSRVDNTYRITQKSYIYIYIITGNDDYYFSKKGKIIPEFLWNHRSSLEMIRRHVYTYYCIITTL